MRPNPYVEANFSWAISIHAPQWGATHDNSFYKLIVQKFQSTHPSGVRRGRLAIQRINSTYFNPRTPVGCDVRAFQDRCGFHQFQSTHPSGVRPRNFQPPTCSHTYFNPRTPVGCDAVRLQLTRRASISIHAPQWGATHLISHLRFLLDISIHAPQWGATPSHPHRQTFHVFQSTHPSGVRPYQPTPSHQPACISIHAPQWGATRSNDLPCFSLVGISIHAPQWGATDRRRMGRVLMARFQSTHPSGVRRG